MSSVATTKGAWPTLRRLHRYNAIFLFVFIVMHFVTHLSGFWGIEAYNSVQADLRKIYRTPLIEIVLLISIGVQLVLGGYLLIKRLKLGGTKGFWSRLQLISGVVFWIFMAQHLFSLGMTRLYFSLDTDFYWPASVMSGPWFIYYFAPYYFLGILSLFAHIGAGVRFVLIERGSGPTASSLGIAFLAVGSLLGLAIPPIIAGAFFPITLPSEWVEYLRFYDPDFEPFH